MEGLRIQVSVVCARRPRDASVGSRIECVSQHACVASVCLPRARARSRRAGMCAPRARAPQPPCAPLSAARASTRGLRPAPPSRRVVWRVRPCPVRRARRMVVSCRLWVQSSAGPQEVSASTLVPPHLHEPVEPQGLLPLGLALAVEIGRSLHELRLLLREFGAQSLLLALCGGQLGVGLLALLLHLCEGRRGLGRSAGGTGVRLGCGSTTVVRERRD